jgi:hypothetical protein
LIGISITDGTLVSNPVISTSIQPFFQSFIYNELTTEIVGLERGGNNGGEVYLAKIDPNTGLVTPISQTSITNSITLNGGQTIDLANQWFHFVSNNRLYTVDIATGNTLYNPLIDTSTALYFDNIVYNEFDGNIYGLARNSDPPEIYLGKINPLNGNVTIISPAPIGQSFVLAGATIDPFSNIYYYKDNNDFVGVDILTGTISTTTPINYTQSNGDFFDFYYYSNEKLSLLSNQGFGNAIDFNFYPNPARDYIEIQGSTIDKVEILDVLGQLKYTLSEVKRRIDVSNLPYGTYFIKAYADGKFEVKKLIKN